MTRHRSLRSVLLRSHLLVMVVAVGTLMLGFGLVAGIAELLEDGRRSGGDRSDGGPAALLAIIGSALIAATFVSRRLAARLARPLEEMRAATRRMAAGDYDVAASSAVVTDPSTEIAGLAADIDALSSTLAETEERRLRLIGEVAHELRTPLSSIEGSMEALMDGVVEPSDEVFAGIARQAARLRRVAGDLSELSRTSDSDVLGDRRVVDLASVAAEVVERLRVQAEAKNLSLDLRAGSAMVDGDEGRLVQVLTNVIGNAIRYTDAGGVTVRVVAVGESAVVTVVDTGPGVDDDMLERIFERFVRADPTQADGTGVGLTIARSLVEAHGGRIVAAPAESGGLQAEVTLPLAVRA